MADLLEVFAEGGAEPPQTLEAVRLGTNATMLLVFTRESEPASLHYVEDPTVHAFVPCCGPGCPVCFIGMAPKSYQLLPVLSVLHRAVQVLRVSTRRGPGTLAAGLLPHLKGDGAEAKLFVIVRDGTKFTVEVRPFGEDADRCTGVIAGFLEAQRQGVRLLSAFPEYSAADLAEVPSIRRALDAVGGWMPPARHNDAGA